jgi:beta-N-acetylhexosaminidase
MAVKDTLGRMAPLRRLRATRRGRLLTTALLALAAGGGLIAGGLVGAPGDDGHSAPVPEASRGRPLERVSFLARLIPAKGERSRPRGPRVPRSVADLAQRLPLERKVAQLFLVGFEGTDLNAEVYVRLRRLDLGGIVLDRHNYTGPQLLGQMAGEALVIARQEGHVPPWVMASQEGGEFNAFPDLPPRDAPADLPDADTAGREAAEAAAALKPLGVTGVLAPDVDVGDPDESPLGPEVYSDDPAEVSGYADAVVREYRKAGVLAAAAHFPGLGAASQPTDEGPATVGLQLGALRRRDLQPFRAAFEAGVPAVILSHALYPMDDFTVPGSLSHRVATDLLRGELRFRGVAITDDLADPAITGQRSVADAAVQAVRAGADMLWISGSASDQQAAYVAVLQAVRRGRLSRRRVDEALFRDLIAKRDYGLIG